MVIGTVLVIAFDVAMVWLIVDTWRAVRRIRRERKRERTR